MDRKVNENRLFSLRYSDNAYNYYRSKYSEIKIFQEYGLYDYLTGPMPLIRTQTPYTGAKPMIARYHVINGTSKNIVYSFNHESEAISHAEYLAKSNPDTDFVVMHSISKSRATKPVETTRF